MTITESRVRQGVLSFGTAPNVEDFSCQPTNVHVTPSYDDDGDRTETLCGDVIPPGKIENYIIGGTSIQDFDDPEGFLTYCFTHAMQTVPFTWQPNVEGAPTFAGQCVILALEEGGDVNTRITTDWEFEVIGRPARTYSTTQQAPTSGTSTSSGTSSAAA